jgi:hypothetical protein
MKKTVLMTICMLIVSCLIGCSVKNENIQWAQTLKANDVERIEAVRRPSPENERYKDFEKSDFSRVIEIINNAKGKKIDNPEQLYGGALTFYITLLDGTRHTFTNNANKHLVIDGVSFEAEYDWLSTWDIENLNAQIPEHIEY